MTPELGTSPPLANSLTLPSKKQGKTSWLWSEEGKALADVKLVLRLLPSASNSTPEEIKEKLASEPSPEDTACEFMLHSVVLSTNSHYFRSRLLSSSASATDVQLSVDDDEAGDVVGQQQQGQQGAVGLRILEERVAPSDVEAARAVLRYMYTEELRYSTPSQLVSVLKVADKWKAAEAVDACRAAFARLSPEEIDIEVIKRVYALEGVVGDGAHFAELLAAVQARMVSLFRDTVDVIRNPGSQSQFLALPFAAVLALLRSDQLVVDCENSVVVLASLWMTRGRGRFASPEQRKYLAGCIRLNALSPSYLCGVLPNLKWFTFPQHSPAAYFATLQARLVSPEARQILLANAMPPAAAAAAGQLQPAARGSDAGAGAASGGSPPTSGSRGSGTGGATAASGGSSSAASGAVSTGLRVPKDQNLELVCDIEFGRLAQYIADGLEGLRSHPEGFKGIHVQSECSYFRGFLWGIKVVFGLSTGAGSGAGSSGSSSPRGSSSPGGAQQQQQPAFTVTPSVFATYPPGEEGMLPLVTPISVSFKCTLDAIGAYGSPYATATFAGASFMRPGDDNVSSIGIANFFKKVASQGDPDSWRPFMYANKLRLKLMVVGASVE